MKPNALFVHLLGSTPSQLTHSTPAHTVQFQYVLHVQPLYTTVVLRIIFLMCIKNYFLFGPRIIFRGLANLFFGLQCIAGLAFEVDWFESLTSLGNHFENFASGGVLSKRMPRRNIVRERNERGFHLFCKICQELVVCR